MYNSGALSSAQLLRKAQITNMVAQQVAIYGQCSDKILSAMKSIPRELFVSDECREIAYCDQELPILAQYIKTSDYCNDSKEDSDCIMNNTDPFMSQQRARTILRPEVCAKILHYADIQRGDLVLDISCSSGYIVALANKLSGRRVIGIDRSLAMIAKAGIAIGSIAGLDCDLFVGHLDQKDSPLSNGVFDVIIVSGSMTEAFVRKHEGYLLKLFRNLRSRFVFVRDDGVTMSVCRYSTNGSLYQFTTTETFENVYASPAFD